MALETIQIKNRRPVIPEEIQNFLSSIHTQDQQNLHFVIRKISLYIVDIFLYRDVLQNINKKNELMEVLNLDILSTIEEQLFAERRRLTQEYLRDKMNEIKSFIDTEWNSELVEGLFFCLGVTDILIKAIKEEYCALTHLSFSERQNVINVLETKYPNMPKKFVHSIRHTIDKDTNIVSYVDGELLRIKSIFLENIPKNYALREYFGSIFEVWENLVDIKNLHTQYQEYVIDSYSEEIERYFRRKENDQKGSIKKTVENGGSPIGVSKNQTMQRYNPKVQAFINKFFPEHFLLHKDLQRIYRKNNFFYKDDLANRLHIDQLSPEMELFCKESGIQVIVRQKEIMPVQSNDFHYQQIIEKEPVSKTYNIESRLSTIMQLSLENRIGEYIELFKELGYSFIKEEEFSQRTLEICRSNIAIEKSIRKILKDRSNGIEEIKKTGRDFYTFQLHNACRIVLPRKREILGIGSHDRYETLLKNNF